MINHKSTHNDIFSDVLDYKNGTTLRIVYDNYIYTGKLLFHEEKENNSWIVLADYIIESEDEIRNATDISYPSTIMLKVSDIKHIELYYNEKNTVL